MKTTKIKVFFSGLAALSLGSLPLCAQSWTAGTGDFRAGANWDSLAAPGPGATAFINNGGTPIINLGDLLDVGSLMLGGDGSGAANLTGNLIINGGTNLISTSLDLDSFVGNTANNFATVGLTTLKLNGGTLMVDDPDGTLSGKNAYSQRFDYELTGTNAWQTSGLNNKDIIVGSKTRGRLELHNDAKVFFGDDLGLANNSGGTGQEASLLMDGTSLIGIGSGAEVGKFTATVDVTLADSAVFASGNSMGPGNPAGQVDEGYFTIGTRPTGNQKVLIMDNAQLQCMTLQNRQGTSSLTLTNQGKFKIHNVFAGSGTIVATRPSYLASQSPCTTTVTLRGNSSFLVDCLLGTTASNGTNGVNGLHIGGGENLHSAVANNPGSYNGTAGGTGILDVRDNATVDIKQSLHLGFGTATSSSGTLQVEGPGPLVQIGWDLNLAFNAYLESLTPGSGARPGTGAVHMVITTNAQAVISVGGTARLTNGVLKLTLQGYNPPPGTSYAIIQAGSLDGPFKTVDLSAASLPSGQSWYLSTTTNSVNASVWPPLLSIQRSGNNVVVQWPGPGQLQSATLVTGPYDDVLGATSPYTNFTSAGALFLRLRQ